MKWTGKFGLGAGASISAAPWPVAARSIMSEREKSLYQDLTSLYPDHKIFVQVALSQLIDVARDHPERMSIRGRFKQLVADFVLCRPDLAIVAVIELDDRTHLRSDRKRADARKTKALGDAGIRLVRVPAGPIPPLGKLKALIEEGRTPEVPGTGIVSELRLIDTGPKFPLNGVTQEAGTLSTAISTRTRKAIWQVGVTVIFLACAWFAYSTVVPSVLRLAFQPLASKSLPRQAAPVQSEMAKVAPVIAGVPSAAPMGIGRPLAERPADQAAIVELQKQKNRAWTAYYSAPSSCEHPAAWNDQVECGNQYMRAKKRFEQEWAATHSADQEPASLVLDNAAISRSRPVAQSRQASQ